MISSKDDDCVNCHRSERRFVEKNDKQMLEAKLVGRVINNNVFYLRSLRFLWVGFSGCYCVIAVIGATPGSKKLETIHNVEW